MTTRDEHPTERDAVNGPGPREAQARLRVLYSFPHRLGTGRISHTAWHQVAGVSRAGAEVTAFASSLKEQFPSDLKVKVRQTLAIGSLRLPFKLVGSMRAFALHDLIVAQRLRTLVGKIDIVHTWPLGALRTLKVARELGIPAVLERPNAHTQFAYEVVRRECVRLGVALPPGHEHSYNRQVLRIEEEEYELADALLCPSGFVVETFIEKGFDPSKLVRHAYGFDEKVYYPAPQIRRPADGLTMLFVGVCAVRKGVHFALEAWLRSPAHETGTFLIAGEFLPAYADKLSSMLSHPSVTVMGHRNDVRDLMRKSDILVLPTIEEGSPLVVAEGMASGCVPLVSDVCTEVCEHMRTGLVHQAGDVGMLTQHITRLHEDRKMLGLLREASLRSAPQFTWLEAGARLLRSYQHVLELTRKLPRGSRRGPEQGSTIGTATVGRTNGS